MTLLVCLGGLSVWAATQLVPGTFLPPLSWPVISACVWLALLHSLPRLHGSDRRQACAGLLSAAMMLLFLLQDGEFNSWGDVYYFCGSRMQYCTCTYRWNLSGWNKAVVLWSFVLTTALGVQRLLVQLVLQGLLPGEEVVTKESLISIGWRLIPYWLNVWEQQWGAECSSMTFELPQYAVELLIILPCVQILCSRMKVLALQSVHAALPRGWENASARQIERSCVPNVHKACWEKRPEQKCIWNRLRANRHVTAFAALLCLLVAFNSLYFPLHLEDAVLAHPRTAVMQAAGRLPQLWETAEDLSSISTQLRKGAMNTTHSFVTQEALQHVMQGRQGAGTGSAAAAPPTGLSALGRMLPNAARRRRSFAGWMAAVERGPWQRNSSWAADAVDGLQLGLQQYLQECPEAGVHHFQHTVWKHHYDTFKMRDPNHRVSVPLIEAALALMRLSTEKFFVLLSLYVAFLLFRTPPPYAAALIGLNARISNTFARLVLYSFPAVCWVYGAGVVFSSLVSAVFWGGPLWQVYHGLRTHACSVSVKGLRPATAAEIERMHHDCAICWCAMTVPGAGHQLGSAGQQQQHVPGHGSATQQGSTGNSPVDATSSSINTTSSAGGPGVAARAGTAAVTDAEPPAVARAGNPHAASAAGLSPSVQQALADIHNLAAAAAAAHAAAAAGGGDEAGASSGNAAVQQRQQEQAGELSDTDGCTLPCGHCYHPGCLTQWLQQCHGQGTPPTCPMCQARMQLAVKWHLAKALFAPAVWQLPTRRRGGGLDDGLVVLAAEGPAAAGAGAAPAAANNYLLRYNPRLAELLADMPQFLTPGDVQLLADVQELRRQRQQLADELQLRQQHLQRLEGVGLRLELQRQQLINELQNMAEQLQQLQQQAQQQQQPGQQQQPDQQQGQPRIPRWLLRRLDRQLRQQQQQQDAAAAQPQHQAQQQHDDVPPLEQDPPDGQQQAQ